jgi:hypothetical protein
MNNYYTYAYLREDKTPYYIGKGKGKRIYQKGKGQIKPPRDKSRIIFLKQNLTEEEAFKHEIYMIAVFGRKDLGTGILHNRTDGGEGISGLVHTEETKRKIGKIKKGNINCLGRVLSEETKRKISEALQGRVLTEEHKKNVAEAGKGKVISEETRRKLSEIRKGRILSEETKRKISRAMKGRVLSEEHKRKISDMSKVERIKKSEAMKKTNLTKWQCKVTGHISNAGGLTSYQKSRGIDISQRARID